MEGTWIGHRDTQDPGKESRKGMRYFHRKPGESCNRGCDITEEEIGGEGKVYEYRHVAVINTARMYGIRPRQHSEFGQAANRYAIWQ